MFHSYSPDPAPRGDAPHGRGHRRSWGRVDPRRHDHHRMAHGGFPQVPPPGGPGGFPFVPPIPPAPPFPEGFGRGRWGRRRHGSRARRGDVRAAILVLLGEEPRSGYQIIQEIGERSRGTWRPSPGSVYPALQQLEDEELVTASGDGGRRVYALTERGREYLEAHAGDLGTPWTAMAEAVDDRLLHLQQVLGQVQVAAGQVAQAGTPAQVEMAVRILTGTRRSLYQVLADGEPEATGQAGSPEATGQAGSPEATGQAEPGAGDGPTGPVR